jgi:hypothetical protein
MGIAQKCTSISNWELMSKNIRDEENWDGFKAVMYVVKKLILRITIVLQICVTFVKHFIVEFKKPN